MDEEMKLRAEIVRRLNAHHCHASEWRIERIIWLAANGLGSNAMILSVIMEWSNKDYSPYWVKRTEENDV